MHKTLLFFAGSSVSSLILYNNFDLSNHFKSAFSLTQDPLIPVKKWISTWDSGDSVSSTTSKATRHILLIRHGQYSYRDNDSDCKLTLLGREQANFTGRRLNELGIEYDRIIHSTMTRAIETAQIISKHIPTIKVAQDPDLIEGVPYVNEPALPHWTPTIETIKEDNLRIEKAYKKYFHRARSDQEKDSYEILVCHANVIRYMLCRALQFPPEGWIRFSLDHASMSWVSIRPNGGVTVRWIGNSGFMPPDIITVA